MTRLRIGVTGHRILTATDRILEGIDLALQHAIHTFQAESVIIVSSLAEGADTIVVERAFQRVHAQLTAILPFSKNDYLEDFKTEESRTRFLSLLKKADQITELPPTEDREASYRAAGVVVLQQSDVLLAIWDGKEAQGKGGTGEIVREARGRGVAISWIRAGNRRPGTQEPTIHPDQGKVTFENFPSNPR